MAIWSYWYAPRTYKPAASILVSSYIYNYECYGMKFYDEEMKKFYDLPNISVPLGKS